MRLLVSESLPTSVVPDDLAPWMDDLDEYAPTATFEEERFDDCEDASVCTRSSWSERVRPTRWLVFIDLI
jgi:hypothetical protein